MVKTKNISSLNENGIADVKLREKLYPKNSHICKINADQLITNTIVRLRMGHQRGMRIDREGRKYYRKCDNYSETELTPDHIFNCH